MKAIFALVAVSMVSSQVGAVPAQQASRATDEVFVPQIFSPNTHSVWKVGTQQTVTWDISNPPSEISNPVGLILMSKGGETIPNLTVASNFSILLGALNVQVPNLAPGNDYRIILLGDSGNDSPPFRI
ncbi:hypothetical protein BDQ12DRAFT_632455, partial [Crucibulum laeve]